ncbi:MAG: hypothetical protein GQ574_07145 [Crocinitomix sp.]|nr:hypothetical protein [Crocinitomix sp.]
MISKHIIAGTIFFGISLFTFITCSSISEEKPSDKNEVLLNWKIPDGEKIEYETVMEEIGESTFEVELGGLFEKMKDSDSDDKKNDFFNKLKQIQSNTSFKTTLSNSEIFQDVVDIEMSATPKESDSEDDSEIAKFQSMLTGIVLRGTVNKDGTLHSFWVKSEQKNLLSMFFELPKGPVSRGDTWTLGNINLIGNDQNYICQEAIKENVVTLTDIVDRDGETIAIVDYNIREYVSGDFVTPSFSGKSGESTKTVMEFQYSAQGEFSVDQGKWVSLTGILSLDASGVMTSTQKQKFSLVEVKN